MTSTSGFCYLGYDTEIKYNSENHLLTCNEENAPLNPVDGMISLRMLVDRTTIEIYANEGRIYMPIRTYREEGESGLEFFVKNNEVNVSTLNVRHLKSIWN